MWQFLAGSVLNNLFGGGGEGDANYTSEQREMFGIQRDIANEMLGLMRSRIANEDQYMQQALGSVFDYAGNQLGRGRDVHWAPGTFEPDLKPRQPMQLPGRVGGNWQTPSAPPITPSTTTPPPVEPPPGGNVKTPYVNPGLAIEAAQGIGGGTPPTRTLSDLGRTMEDTMGRNGGDSALINNPYQNTTENSYGYPGREAGASGGYNVVPPGESGGGQGQDGVTVSGPENPGGTGTDRSPFGAPQFMDPQNVMRMFERDVLNRQSQGGITGLPGGPTENPTRDKWEADRIKEEISRGERFMLPKEEISRLMEMFPDSVDPITGLPVEMWTDEQGNVWVRDPQGSIRGAFGLQGKQSGGMMGYDTAGGNSGTAPPPSSKPGTGTDKPVGTRR